MKLHLLCLAFLLKYSISISQDHPYQPYDFEQMAERIFPLQELDVDYSQLYENFAQLVANPIDLNNASKEQLSSLYILSEIQLNDLLKYRDEYGPLISVYELQAISGFDQNTINKLVPFVTVKTVNHNQKLIKRILSEENNYLLLRQSRVIENKTGYQFNSGTRANYLGSPNSFYARYRIAHPSDFSLGFTFEKDPGEQLKWNPAGKQYGFDYNSFHFQLLNQGIVKNFIIGDFQAQFGQGLILGGGFGIGKGAESITTLRKSNIGFIPYTSINETGFFRGVATSISLSKHFSIDAFLSRNARDAAFSSDSTGASSVPTTGLHRNKTELDNRSGLVESNYGTVISYQQKALKVGAILHHTIFSSPISPNPTLYNQYYFRGIQNKNIGVYLNYTLHNMTIFSESAYTINHGKAMLLGSLASLTPSFDLAMLFRNYDKDFRSFYGNAFAENSRVQNESGFYLGWKYHPHRKHMLTSYFDVFKFPWLRYRGYAPSVGHEWMLRYTFQPSKETLFYVQAREESKIRNSSSETLLFHHANGIKRNYWINLDYAISRQLSFKSRVQWSNYSIGTKFTNGFALIQDLNFHLNKLTISGRYALFDTEDYDNRQYVYERDVWLAFSFPFYNGIGLKNYLLIQYSLNKKTDLWLRWSHIKYVDREIIGSGNERIDGNTSNEIKFQIRLKF